MSSKSLHISALMVKKLELIEQFQNLSLVSELTLSGVKLGMLKLTSNILEKIKNGQKEDLELVDFVGALSKNMKGFDSICVIIDRLTKSTHFIPIKTGMSVRGLQRSTLSR